MYIGLQVRTQAITALDYGRVPDPSLLCTKFPIELILDGIKYCVTVPPSPSFSTRHPIPQL